MAGRYRNLWYFVCKYFFSLLPDFLYHNALAFVMHCRSGVPYHWMNIKHPKTFSEKLQYLKKHPVSPDEEKLADKYTVRDYIKNKIGDNYLIPLVGNGIYDNADSIDFSSLPNEFVLKLTKGSGYNFICTDKSKLNFDELRNLIRGWLKINPYYMSRESQYKGKSRIVCEKMLEYNITDYKFFCFNGEPTYVELFLDRQKEHKKVFYDMNWNRMPFTTGNTYSNIEVDKPTVWKELVYVAKKLSEDFAFVRVDLYVHDNQVYFGELTFHPAGGYTPITPREWDYKLGEKLNLN